MSASTDVLVRTHIVLGNGDRLYCVESYQDVYDRVSAARETPMRQTQDSLGSPFGAPLVNVRIAIRLEPGEDAPVGVVDCAFSPMHLVSLFRAHPDV